MAFISRLSLSLGIGLNSAVSFFGSGASRPPGDYAVADYAAEDYRLSEA